MAEPWLSANGITARLGITKDIVYIWIAEKAMPAHKVEHLWKFHASEVDTWVWAGAAASNAKPSSDDCSPDRRGNPVIPAPFIVRGHNPDILTYIESSKGLYRYGLYDTVVAIDEQTTA
ncbi:excisionase family DNA binding domain-containing protein [Propionibacterium sp. oral taxon 192 str. F0372]|uniref:excisionase family DNA-binding protein n=1 Tax=Propionibacterium sp. oral taxon 192 TaxID=671222 RepID=UPI000353B636|nr:excisionase family DNA-binding protein [Propionibacterium sp. oral taxon 192]EPH07065.1 excisionase family DNA binding domain-containing protein [Propionibacterium sp. oral taxon 192 str. F0372]